MRWLERLFKSKPEPVKVPTVVVIDEPNWSSDDAARMRSFLNTITGRRLISRMHHQVLSLCMQDHAFTERDQAERRALRMTIAGIYGHADVDHFQQLEKEKAHENLNAE